MTMKGIDISDYQRGLDLGLQSTTISFSARPQKARTSSTTRATRLSRRQSGWASSGDSTISWERPTPLHRRTSSMRTARTIFGRGVPMLDYEDYGRIGTDKAKAFLDRIYELTGVRCIVYISRSVCTEEDWREIGAESRTLGVAVCQ